MKYVKGLVTAAAAGSILTGCTATKTYTPKSQPDQISNIINTHEAQQQAKYASIKNRRVSVTTKDGTYNLSGVALHDNIIATSWHGPKLPSKTGGKECSNKHDDFTKTLVHNYLEKFRIVGTNGNIVEIDTSEYGYSRKFDSIVFRTQNSVYPAIGEYSIGTSTLGSGVALVRADLETVTKDYGAQDEIRTGNVNSFPQHVRATIVKGIDPVDFTHNTYTNIDDGRKGHSGSMQLELNNDGTISNILTGLVSTVTLPKDQSKKSGRISTTQATRLIPLIKCLQ